MDSKRIGTFKQFLQEQRMKKINEAKLHVEVEWWDECIVEVLQELEDECQGYLVWDRIITICKEKWAILGRELPLPVYEDSLLTHHIKDLIYQFHGKSLYTDCKCDLGWDNAQIHSKGLVIEELAAVILDKVKEKAKPEDETDAQNPTGTLSDREETTLVPMKPAAVYDNCEDEYYEDLPFEKKQVYGIEKYSKMIEEAKTEFKLANKQKVIDYTLNRLEQEVGSLKLDDIAHVAVSKYGFPKDDEGYAIFNKYIKSIVMECLNDKGMVQTLVKKNRDMCISKNVLDGIFNLFAEMVIEDIQHMLVEKDRKDKEGEDAEVE